jgi:small subunit ribosomal protein S6
MHWKQGLFPSWTPLEAGFPTYFLSFHIFELLLLPKLNFLTNKQGSMNNYELMVIFTPVLSDDDFKASQKKFTDLIKSIGGEIVHENPWGLKSLAYPVQKKTTGLYWVMEYKAPSNLNEQLKIQLLRDDNVLRHMFTVLDKYAVEYNGKKRSGVPTGTEKVEG